MNTDWITEMVEFQETLRPGGVEQRCYHCQFWEHNLIIESPDQHELRGECHRHAPSPTQHMLSMIGRVVGATAWACEETANVKHDEDGRDFGTDYTFEGADQHEIDEWPLTKGEDWCGDFVGRTSEQLALRDARTKELREMYERAKHEIDGEG